MLKQDLSTNIIQFPVELSKAIPKIKKTKSITNLLDYFKGKNTIWIKRKKANTKAHYLVVEIFEKSLCAGQDLFINSSTMHNFMWTSNRGSKTWNEFPQVF